MLRRFLQNKNADMNMIITAIILAIALGVGLLVVWNVLGTLDTDTVDSEISENIYGNASSWNIRPAYNASLELESNLETFYTVAPIVLIVVAAVGILGYVLLLKRRG